ncbi:LIM domain protein [Necator americanus]|uniref:LIM domain protein n=1 Tax=Necator americanus TaxID=51031 RepID=W2SHN8_NECAM|nr:LIM domain protein [Necator americanus]ETN69078.1 LIM domain protein [Necator americanus]
MIGVMQSAELVDLDEQSPTFCEATVRQQFSATAFRPVGSSTSPAQAEEAVCAVCGYEIKDQFVLRVMSDSFHECCLRCVACNQNLSNSPTCFSKDGRLYCREDHSILFGRFCARCHGALASRDLVFRCQHATYHQQCFSCFYCHMQFKKGDEYLIVEGEIVCRKDYHMLLQNHLHSMAGPPVLFDFESSESSRKTPKRPRTILNATQRKQFKAAFEKSAKPCRKIREQLAKETGLSVRVVQMKKMQRKEESKRGSSALDSEGKSIEGEKSSDEENCSDCDDLEMEHPEKPYPENPIEKLYHMHSTYFQFT